MIGRQLRDARRRADKNQEWLAHELGITYQQLGKYERGESSLKVWMLAKASRLLGVPGSVFMDSIIHPGLAESGAVYEPTPSPDEEFRKAFERAAALWPRVKGP